MSSVESTLSKLVIYSVLVVLSIAMIAQVFNSVSSFSSMIWLQLIPEKLAVGPHPLPPGLSIPGPWKTGQVFHGW